MLLPCLAHSLICAISTTTTSIGWLSESWLARNATTTDPIDAYDIGSAVAETGAAYRAKVLGALGLIDDDETDWKVIVINTEDPDAGK